MMYLSFKNCQQYNDLSTVNSNQSQTEDESQLEEYVLYSIEDDVNTTKNYEHVDVSTIKKEAPESSESERRNKYFYDIRNPTYSHNVINHSDPNTSVQNLQSSNLNRNSSDWNVHHSYNQAVISDDSISNDNVKTNFETADYAQSQNSGATNRSILHSTNTHSISLIPRNFTPDTTISTTSTLRQNEEKDTVKNSEYNEHKNNDNDSTMHDSVANMVKERLNNIQDKKKRNALIKSILECLSASYDDE